jgi:toxin ParE1/3/4
MRRWPSSFDAIVNEGSLLRRAQADLEAIYTYLDKHAPAAARSIKDLIERRISSLADLPFMAPRTEIPGVRELSLARYPYQIYYEVEGEEIWILHVRDARRRPWDRQS